MLQVLHNKQCCPLSFRQEGTCSNLSWSFISISQWNVLKTQHIKISNLHKFWKQFLRNDIPKLQWGSMNFRKLPPSTSKTQNPHPLTWSLMDPCLLLSPFLVLLFINSSAWVSRRKKFKDLKNSLILKGPLRFIKITFGSGEPEKFPLLERFLHLGTTPLPSPPSPCPSYLFLCPTPGRVALQAWYPSSPERWLLLCYAGQQ